MPVFLTLSTPSGDVTFSNLEVPSSINFGGEQGLSDKKIIGGKRDVSAMGRIDDDIAWSGMFRGATATFRARFLDGIRAKGQLLKLTWSQFNYSVVMKSFRPNFQQTYNIPYSISFVVVQDLNKPFPVLLPVAYDEAISDAMIEARDLAATIRDPGIASSIALLSVTINSIASISNASSSVLAKITGPLNSAKQATAGFIGTLSGGSLPGATAAPEDKASNEIADDYFRLADAYLLQAILTQIETNLRLITVGATGQTITINGGNLFQIASQYYGDFSLWTVIAKANGLVDPKIYPGKVTTLVIPVQTTDTGGVYIS